MQTVSLKEKQRRERENLILQTAEEILYEKGYYDTAMDEIAAKVGIAKGTIYSHFPGKEELVTAIFERNTQAFFLSIDELIHAETTPRTRFETILHFIFTGMVGKQMQLLSILMQSGMDMKKLLSKEGCIKDLWENLVARIRVLLDEGKAAGEFSQNIPTGIMLISLFSLFSPRSYQKMLLDDNLSQEEIVAYLMQVYFRGIDQ